MEINNEKINAAFAAAKGNKEMTEVLSALFGRQEEKLPVTERIKTLDDAIKELGEHNPLVVQYMSFEPLEDDADYNDIVAYLKLRIIVAALNEGWTPQFSDDEYRWYPWFKLYTEEEFDKLADEDKAHSCRCVGRSFSNAHANGGLVYAYADYAFSFSSAFNGARLAFRTEELAVYAGQQFLSIYSDYLTL